jgi:hypothetical protein
LVIRPDSDFFVRIGVGLFSARFSLIVQPVKLLQNILVIFAVFAA